MLLRGTKKTGSFLLFEVFLVSFGKDDFVGLKHPVALRE